MVVSSLCLFPLVSMVFYSCNTGLCAQGMDGVHCILVEKVNMELTLTMLPLQFSALGHKTRYPIPSFETLVCPQNERTHRSSGSHS